LGRREEQLQIERDMEVAQRKKGDAAEDWRVKNEQAAREQDKQEQAMGRQIQQAEGMLSIYDKRIQLLKDENEKLGDSESRLKKIEELERQREKTAARLMALRAKMAELEISGDIMALEGELENPNLQPEQRTNIEERIAGKKEELQIAEEITDVAEENVKLVEKEGQLQDEKNKGLEREKKIRTDMRVVVQGALGGTKDMAATAQEMLGITKSTTDEIREQLAIAGRQADAYQLQVSYYDALNSTIRHAGVQMARRTGENRKMLTDFRDQAKEVRDATAKRLELEESMVEPLERQNSCLSCEAR
jgi:hypothetical protein